MYETVFPSLLITFREALEAALIVTIMISYLRKIGKQELNKYCYLGAGVGVVASLLVGISLQTIYGGLSEIGEQLFEGIASLTAVIVLTSMIFWMAKHSREIRGELEVKIEHAVTQREVYSITTLSFVAVAREGLETVLFLTTAFLQDRIGTIVGATIGISIVLALSALLMKETVNLEISRFFKVTSLLLLMFGAGLAGYGVHELIEAGEASGMDFGVLGEKAFDINPPVNPDGTFPLLHENGVIGSILKALLGYDGNPEWLRVFAYVFYWAIIGTYLYTQYPEDK